MSNGKGPKVKSRGGEEKLKESKAKALLFKRKQLMLKLEKINQTVE